MKRSRTALLLAAAALACAGALAETVDQESLRLPTTGKFAVSPPTAEAAALSRHAEGSFDYATGRVSYNFPLYALSGDGVSLQISLGCQAGALKVDEEPGQAGAGWTLSLGGYVSRSICGRPDEESGIAAFSPLSSPSDDPAYLRSLARDYADGAYDRYSYQAGASSGQFVIDRYGNVIQLPQTDNKIEKRGNGFRITTPDGVTYRYVADEAVRRESHNINPEAKTRNGDYAPATRRWRLASISNPQRTDSIAFAYGDEMPEREYAESKQKTRSASMQHWSTALGGEAKEGGENQGLPENYTTYYYSSHRRLQSISWRSDTVQVIYEDNLTDAVKRLSVRDSIGREAVGIVFGYGSSFASGTGHNYYKTGGTVASSSNMHRILAGFRVMRDGTAVDGADFAYFGQGTPMRSKDLFGYCNGSDAPSGYASVLDFDSDGNIMLSQARTPSFSDACRNALREIKSLSGGVTALEYEPNTIPGAFGLNGTDRAADLTIGIRLKRETVTDISTGSVRVRELSYSAPASSIGFWPIGIEPFVSVGGTISVGQTLGGGDAVKSAPAASAVSTGVSLLAGSRSPGAPIEGACIYYGKVDEKISGTGLDRPLLSTYEFDLSEAACPYMCGNLSPIGQNPDLKYCGTGHGGIDVLHQRWMPLFRPMALTSYFRETFGEKAPLARLTQWRFTASGDTVPYMITEHAYGKAGGAASEKELVLGYYCESLLRDAKVAGVAHEAPHNSASDFMHYPIKAKAYSLRLRQTVVTEYADDGSSRQKTIDYDYNDLYTEVPYTFYFQGKPYIAMRPPGGSPSLVPNGLLRRQAVSCAGDTASALHFYACDGGDQFKDARDSGWLSLPVKTVVRHGSATSEAWYAYSYSDALGYRLASETLLADSAVAWQAEILGLDSRGNPARASVNGLPAEAYAWDANGRLVARVVGGRLRWQYEHIPLAGLSQTTSPSGLVANYDYSAGRLSAVKLNGGIVKRYEYSLCYDSAMALSAAGNAVEEWTLYGGSVEAASKARFDAFGREIASGSFAKGQDQGVAVFSAYDAIGRKMLETCPATASIGVPKADDYTDYAAYISSLALAAYPDRAPYASHSYRACADPAPAASTIPGAGFAACPAKAARYFNGQACGAKALKCRRFVPVPGGVMESGSYPDGALEITERADGDGRLSYTFTDFRGRVVLERAVPGANSPESDFLDTYYVYDDADNLLFVLPPLAVDGMPAQGHAYTMESCQAMRDHAYAYAYDSRRRLASKTLPGAGATVYAYDASGALVLTQDAAQRQRGAASFAAADSCGRPAVKGECAYSAELAAALGGTLFIASLDGGPLGGYSLPIELPQAKLDMAMYYDGYGFLDGDGFAEVKGLVGSPAPRPGLQTGAMTRVYGAAEDEFERSATAYDERERPILTAATLLGGGAMAKSVRYNNAGLPVCDTVRLSMPDGSSATLASASAYDSLGRQASQQAGLVGGSASSSEQLAYDDKGRLASAAYAQGSPGQTTMSYSYQARGAMSAARKNGAPFIQLFYTGSSSGLITKQRWFDRGGSSREYSYSYDGFGRLTSAAYSASASVGGAAPDYSCQYAYDKASRPTAIMRRGLAAVAQASGEAACEFGVVDDLTLAYSGAFLSSVSDLAADPAYSGASDFADGADAGYEYGYDANSNVVRDDNRGIKSIAYNPLNLPQEVRFADGHYIRQAYSADGRLLRRVTGQEPLRELPTRPWLGLGVAAADPAAFVFPGDKPILPDTTLLAKVETPDTVAWAGPFVLEGGKLDRVLTPSGYIKADTAYYFLRDHQGSVRQVVSGADGSVVQENQYYPYGSLHGESSAQALANGASAQPYKYGGKEHIALANAHLLDFTARTYDPALALFHQPDPLREINYGVSSYLYCHGNPVNFADPSGMTDIICQGKQPQYVDDGLNQVIELNEDDYNSMVNIGFDSTHESYSGLLGNGTLRTDLYPTVSNVLAGCTFVPWKKINGKKPNCRELAEKQNNCAVEGRSTSIDLYTTDGAKNFDNGTDYMIKELQDGRSVVVGVWTGDLSHKNPNEKTGHFLNVVGVGIGYKNGEFFNYITYYDNRTANIVEGTDLVNNRFVIGSVGGEKVWHIKKEDKTIYIITEVRHNIIVNQ